MVFVVAAAGVAAAGLAAIVGLGVAAVVFGIAAAEGSPAALDAAAVEGLLLPPPHAESSQPAPAAEAIVAPDRRRNVRREMAGKLDRPEPDCLHVCIDYFPSYAAGGKHITLLSNRQLSYPRYVPLT